MGWHCENGRSAAKVIIYVWPKSVGVASVCHTINKCKISVDFQHRTSSRGVREVIKEMQCMLGKHPKSK